MSFWNPKPRCEATCSRSLRPVGEKSRPNSEAVERQLGVAWGALPFARVLWRCRCGWDLVAGVVLGAGTALLLLPPGSSPPLLTEAVGATATADGAPRQEDVITAPGLTGGHLPHSPGEACVSETGLKGGQLNVTPRDRVHHGPRRARPCCRVTSLPAQRRASASPGDVHLPPPTPKGWERL